MKNILKSVLSVFCLSMSFAFSNTYRISVSNNMLVFESSKDYYTVIRDLSPDQKQDFIHNVNTNYDFNSLYKNKNSELYLKFDDDLFASILNHKAYVQVGNNIYKINPYEGVVYVIPASNPELIVQMEAGNFTSTLIKTYQSDDEVIGMVENNIAPAHSKLFCNESGSTEKKAEQSVDLTNPINGTACNWMDCEVSYKTWGIYFTLKAKCNNFCPSRRMYWHKTPAAYKVKCGYTYGPVYQWDIDSGGNGSSAWTWQNYFYQNVQPLSAYWLRVVFMAKDAAWIGNPDNPSADLEIRKNM